MSDPKKNPGILRLEVSNLLRVKAVEVNPTGPLVVVAGANDQGKTSILNSIAIALSGKDLPVMPIRQGAASGYVILETEGLIVTRKFSLSGGAVLEVRDREGARVTSPQTKLDALVSRVTFDPFEFTRMKPGEQLNTVRQIAGLDFTELNAEYKTKYDQRTEINRQAKNQEGVLSGVPRDPSAPKEQISVAKLAEDLKAANDKNKENDAKRSVLSQMNDEIDAHDAHISSLQAGIEKLELELRQARTALEYENNAHAQLIEQRDEQKQLVVALEDADVAPIMAAISNADATNETVRNNARWNDEHKKLVALQSSSGELTDRLREIESEKQAMLEKAKFPVEGLGFSDEGVTFQSVPFDQAGTAVKIRVSVAIARSLNPGLPVMLIRDGSLLDAHSLSLLKTEAEEHGLQCWLECVGDRDDATVVIEDGTVIATAETKAAAKKKK